MGRRSRQRATREKLQAPTSDYRDEAGNVLTLRGSLTSAARREYADMVNEQRSTELLQRLGAAAVERVED